MPSLTPTPTPTSAPGPVALVGSGEFLPVMEPIDGALLAGRPPRAVILPTAAAPDGPARVRYWIDLGCAHFRRLGVEPVPLDVVDADGAADPAAAAAVAGAGLVYLSGGDPGHLVRTLRDSPLWAAIEAAWRAGTALAGCSAGAMVLGSMAFSPFGGAPEPGLGVVFGVAVLPHFDRLDRWRPGLAAEAAASAPDGVVVVGIDEDTALVGSAAGPWHVAGARSACIVGRDGSRTYLATGEQVGALNTPGARGTTT